MLGKHVVIFAEAAEPGFAQSSIDGGDAGCAVEPERREFRNLFVFALAAREAALLEFAQDDRLCASDAIVERESGASNESGDKPE
ncbi:MAG: hypothetical protein EBV14_01440 [Actinobacteria bacterium]|nr:hypothetical protein [Actinomycetota bacterium]